MAATFMQVIVFSGGYLRTCNVLPWRLLSHK